MEFFGQEINPEEVVTKINDDLEGIVIDVSKLVKPETEDTRNLLMVSLTEPHKMHALISNGEELTVCQEIKPHSVELWEAELPLMFAMGAVCIVTFKFAEDGQATA